MLATAPLAALAARVVDTPPHPEGDAAARRARLLLLDTLACAIAARGHPVVRKASAAAQALFSGAAATGLASGWRLGLAGAVLDSGAAIRALDYNDFYWGPGIGGHPSDLYALTLAVAESANASLGDLLHATTVGYEVYLRLLDGMRSDGAWDHTSAMALAGAAAAGRLMGLAAPALAHALAIAAVRAPALAALRQGAISEAKAVAPALGAIEGLMAAQLAAAGITGPLVAAGGPQGLQAVVRPGVELAALADAQAFGSRITAVSVKRYPCIGTAQAAVAAACELHRQAQAAGRAIERVDMQLADHHLVRHQTTEPYRRAQARETADHSFYALLAMAMVDGDLTPRQFDVGRWRDAEVQAMADRLCFSFELPGGSDGVFPAHGQAQLAGGLRVAAVVDHPPGHPSQPLDEDGVAAKFRSCVAGRLAPARADAVIAFCLNGDARAPLHPLFDLLHPESEIHD